MKHKWAILSAVICLTSPAQAQMGGSRANPGTGPIDPNGDQPPVHFELPTEPEARAEDLRLQGKCSEAVPILQRLAGKGADYAVSQYNLGLCLFDLGNAEPDAQHAASLRREAAGYIVQAANNGFAKAQKSLVTIYLDGTGVASDPVEAGKWSLIYHSNSMRIALGLPDLAPDVQTRLDSTLSDKNWAEAQSRAALWSPAPTNEDTEN
jgi:hypothetical protein